MSMNIILQRWFKLFSKKPCLLNLVELPGQEISPAQGLYLHRTAKHRKARTNIHTFSGIRTHYQIVMIHAQIATTTAIFTLELKYCNLYFTLAFCHFLEIHSPYEINYILRESCHMKFCNFCSINFYSFQKALDYAIDDGAWRWHIIARWRYAFKITVRLLCRLFYLLRTNLGMQSVSCRSYVSDFRFLFS
jgi:hypothetical protein